MNAAREALRSQQSIQLELIKAYIVLEKYGKAEEALNEWERLQDQIKAFSQP